MPVKISCATERPLRAGFVAFLALAAGCGGGGGGGGGGPGPGGSSGLEAALNDLGVDTGETPRRDEEGDALPSGYSPFGASWELAKTSEILLLGVNVNATGAPFSLVDVTSEAGNPALEVMHAKSAAEAAWARETRSSRALPGTLRAAAAADVDGDGLEEAVIVYQDDLETRVVTVEDEPSGFGTTDDFLGLEFDVTHVAVRAGDYDGDGTDELVLGLSEGGLGGTGELRFARRDAGVFELVPQRNRSFAPTLANATLWLQLASGNLDHDSAEELVVVVNEEARDFNGNATSSARFHVLDDATTGFAELLSGPVQGRDQTNTLRTAVVATPAIGDVDGDGAGEVLFGCLTGYSRHCDSASYLLLALDDADRGLAPLPGRFFTHFYDDCDSPADPQVRTVHLNALDIDGDGRDEVQANLFVFQDWVEAAPWTEVPAWRLPETVFFRQGEFAHLDLNTSTVVVGDFTGDEREDVAVYRQDTTEIGVWGVSAISVPPALSKLRSVPVAFHNSQVPVNPVLVPVNADTDSPVLRYDEAEYQLVFSEPILLAALAAAPAKSGIRQNADACRTTFGNTESSSSEEERSVTVTVSASVGFQVDGGPLSQSEFELKETATVAATRITGHAYTLRKTILFTSGPSEDLVVFTTLPLDQYTYTVLSHPDPALIGQKVVVSLPRDPITLQAERGFYNRTVPAGSLKVDDRIFGHAIGDPASYPTRTEKTGLLSQHGGGLQIGPVSVGQGSGETEVTLEVEDHWSQGGTLELDFEIEMEATGATILGGFSIGAGTSKTLRVTSGEATTYTGTVGAIDAADFAAHRYSFGLFTYVYRDPSSGQELEVLDYWVE